MVAANQLTLPFEYSRRQKDVHYGDDKQMRRELEIRDRELEDFLARLGFTQSYSFAKAVFLWDGTAWSHTRTLDHGNLVVGPLVIVDDGMTVPETAHYHATVISSIPLSSPPDPTYTEIQLIPPSSTEDDAPVYGRDVVDGTSIVGRPSAANHWSVQVNGLIHLGNPLVNGVDADSATARLAVSWYAPSTIPSDAC